MTREVSGGRIWYFPSGRNGAGTGKIRAPGGRLERAHRGIIVAQGRRDDTRGIFRHGSSVVSALVKCDQPTAARAVGCVPKREGTSLLSSDRRKPNRRPVDLTSPRAEIRMWCCWSQLLVPSGIELAGRQSRLHTA